MNTRISFAWLLAPLLALSAVAADLPTHGTNTVAALTPAANLPKVFIIGDSISMGYTPVVQQKLKGIAEVSRPADNCAFTGHGLQHIHAWLGTQHWDVIHFNFGIWDTHHLNANGAIAEGPGTHPRYTPEEYRENLTKLVAILEGTGAKLIWASSTPVTARKGKRFEDLIEFNAVAAKLMQAHKIPVDDLYELVMPNVKTWDCGDGCHFLPLGYEHLGQHVADSIQAALRAAQPTDRR